MRGDVIDLRKVGFVPLVGDIQPAGVIHRMGIDLAIDPARRTIESLETEQPVVAIEPSSHSAGECCRDPAPRLQALVGESLDGEFARALSGAFGGPRGCSHLLTLFQLTASAVREALALEDGAATTREERDRLFRRSVFVEGFESPEDEAIEMVVQLADFHTRAGVTEDALLDRLAGQWDVRAFARTSGPERSLSDMLLAHRFRTRADLGTAEWHDRSDALAPLAGTSIVGGVARRLFGCFPEPEDRRLLDAALQLAPGYIQVMAAVMDRWFALLANRPAEEADREPSAAEVDGPVGGTPDSCYMWRSDGPMLARRKLRTER